MKLSAFKYSLAAVAATMCVGTAQAVTLAENVGPTTTSRNGCTAATGYFCINDQAQVGQSFTTTGSTSDFFNAVSVSFLAGGNYVNLAKGTLYLFDSAYTGAASTLNNSANILASAVAVNNVWSFLPTLQLAGATKYYLYTSDEQTFNDSYPYRSTYSGGELYVVNDATNRFVTDVGDIAFRVSGTAVPVVIPPVVVPPVVTPPVTAAVPEPATWAMMIAGFGLVGGAMRRRRHQVAVRYA